MIGYAFCGSYCTFAASFAALKELIAAGEDVLPIFGYNAATTDTRFGRGETFLREAETLCGHSPVLTVVDAEPLGPKTPLEALIIAPCTGNTLAKLAQGITDTPVTMAAKAHLRQGRPLLLALASNDAMAANLKNIASLLEKKSVYFVPMKQDDPEKKPHSLVADFPLLPVSLADARQGRQKRPLFL
jgi:dipicolinate synthase subunit B